MKNISYLHLIFLFSILLLSKSQILDPIQLGSQIFTEEILGNLSPLLPTKLGYSKLWPFPIQTYQIAAMRAKHQFLPQGFPPTQIFAYAGKVGDKFIPSFPGPSLMALKNTPIYVIWNNNIEGKHLLTVDYSNPFKMLADLGSDVPTVPHAHGLESQMGSDGQPQGYWTKSGKKGKQFFTLKSKNLKENQAIFRYHNTKEGLFWFHDHTMGMTRLNVYAGLVGFYEIIDPSLSYEQKNILKLFGDVQRKYFVIVDKTFNIDGSLFYPSSTQSQGYTSWVPQFFGNTITVNGKVWPKITLEPKLYRFVFLNGCQSRFLRISFENNGQQLQFKIFRRDSDYLKIPISLTEYMLVTGARIEIFIDLSQVIGQVLMKNSAYTPFPMGDSPDQFTSKIMKIVVAKNPITPRRSNLNIRKPQIVFQNSTTPSTLLNLIDQRFIHYRSKPYNSSQQQQMDFIDISQIPNINDQNKLNSKQISLIDFKQSNDDNDIQFTNWVSYLQFQQSDPVAMVKINLAQQQSYMNEMNRIYRVNPIPNGQSKQSNMITTITNVTYPRFSTGTPYFTILNQVLGTNGDPKTIKIDDVGLKMGCTGATFKQSETYDFYIINLTMDDHPIHIHLVNFQVIGRFEFDIERFAQAWRLKNGQFLGHARQKMPDQVDPRPFQISPMQPPLQQQKQFLDVITVPTRFVTVARVKFSNHYGRKFPQNIKGARYVWHCHILEHEDNEMMRYFCVQ